MGGSGGPATKNEYVVAPLLAELNNLVTSINRGAVMAEFLKKEAEVNVKTFAPGDYAGTQIGPRDGTIDFAFLPPALFVKAQDDSGAQALFALSGRDRIGRRRPPSSASSRCARTRALPRSGIWLAS